MAEEETKTNTEVEPQNDQQTEPQDPTPKDDQKDQSAVDKLTSKFQKRIDKLTASNSDYKSKLEEAEKQLEDLKSGKVSVKDLLKEQKSTKEDDEKDQRIAQLEAQLQREKDLQSTREAFSEDGLTIPDSVLNMVVSTNQQTTVDNIGAIKSFVNTIRDSAKKEALRGTTPRTNGKSATSLSKADISKIKDPIKRVQAIKDNMSLYK
jgi:predicted RNase H-like nuclease (RuvC/YqgF family)